jgi:glycerol-1-phosphate dehydrogenase [NAD(P)+]
LRGDTELARDIDVCLRRHGLPRTPAELGLSEEQFAEAVLHAPATRPDRFTILEHLALDAKGVREHVHAFLDAHDR